MRWILRVLSVAILVITGASPLAAYQKEIHDQALAIMAKIGQTDRKSVAVVDFTDLQGNVTELGRFLAEELSVALSELGREPNISVIDRTHLKIILAEHKLSATGLMDPQAARRVAAIAGVDALVTGTVTPLGDSGLRLTIKVLDVETAKIAAATSVDIPRTQAIEALLGARISEMTVSESPSPQSSRRTESAKGAEQELMIGNIRIQLQECRLSGGEVACSFLMTSLQQDREVFLSGWKAVDEFGNEYRGSRPLFGSKVGVSRVSGDLIADVSVRAGVRFQSVAARARTLAVIEFSLNHKPAQFRGIPLTP